MTRTTGPLQNRRPKIWSATEPVRGILGAPFGSEMDRYYYHGGTGERGASSDRHQGAADRDGACAPKAHDATDPANPVYPFRRTLDPRSGLVGKTIAHRPIAKRPKFARQAVRQSRTWSLLPCEPQTRQRPANGVCAALYRRFCNAIKGGNRDSQTI